MDKLRIKKAVFFPSIIIMGLIVMASLLNGEFVVSIGKVAFDFILDKFGWLYQWTALVCLVLAFAITFSKVGNIKLGGADAKPKFSFMSWFALTLTGGVATGLITYSGVNEPIVYLSNIYGELNNTGIEAGTEQAAIFAIARNFYNWTYFPYAIYSISGVLMAYTYFNKKGSLNILSTLEPILGEKAKNETYKNIIDVVAILALCLGLASTMGAALTMLGSFLEVVYKINATPIITLIIALIITFLYTTCAYIGLDKGIKVLADITTKLLYVLLIVIFILGPTLYILKASSAGFAYWLDNFWVWSLDTGIVGGDALVKSWTLFDWSLWIAFAPLMGVFFGMIAYGRTIREFMIINFILPSTFALLWVGIWAPTALRWELDGKTNVTDTIINYGFISGFLEFLDKIPFIGFIAIPVVIVALIASFSTTADTMTLIVANMCTSNLKDGEEAPKWQKLVWGIFIGVMSYTMVAFGGGTQGIDGVKFLGVAAGFVILGVFLLQIVSAIKVFFIDKNEYNK